jgi:putative hydrolase of the HAD superfamily
LKARFFAGDQVDYRLAEEIRELKKKYLTGVISNAMSGARTFLVEEIGLGEFFDSLTYSFEVGVMKPEAGIFESALKSLNVTPEQSVFLDDFQHNVAGALAVGMQAIHFRNPAQAMEELEAVLKSS